MNHPIRSPRHQTGGLYVFARVLDKIRLHSQDRLPQDYHLGLIAGSRTFDDRLCKFLSINFDDLSLRTLEGGDDDDILEWCLTKGTRPDAEQIEIWNAFVEKRGWRDSASAALEKAKINAGLANDDRILTFFDLMDAEEGRS